MNGTDNKGCRNDWKTHLQEADAAALERMRARLSELRANLGRDQSDRLGEALKALVRGMTCICSMAERLRCFNHYAPRQLFEGCLWPAGYLLCAGSLVAMSHPLDLYASAAAALREAMEAST